ncbi:MAG: flagellar biosynthetic protein FliO [Terracidiphilus sp.]
MIEKQPKPYSPYQPPHERLAYLLAQLSELDPEPVKKLKLEPVPVKKLNLEPVPVRKPVKKASPEPNRRTAKKAGPTRKPATKLKPEPGRARKTVKKPAPQQELDRNSFHAVLRGSTKKLVEENPRQRHEDSSFRPWLELTQRGPISGLARIWSWLHSKYTKTTAKRLRLSEVVSLGDKRFVALVKVEDREFLVGGAASGLSLLAQLEKTSEPGNGRKRGIGVEGHSH